MYRSWHIRCNRPNFLSFWVIFCPFTFNHHPENQNFEIKKTPKDIIILNMCTINDDQMMYVSWDMQCYGHNFLSFWAIFVFLYHSNPENHNFEKMKQAPGDAIILHMCTKNHNHMMYASWDMEYNRYNFCHFGPFFALLPHYWPQKLRFGKNVKAPWKCCPFTHVYYTW